MMAAHQKPPLLVVSAAMVQVAIQPTSADAQRQLVTQPVLPVAKRKRANHRSDIEHKNEHHGLLLHKADHLLGVDRRQRDGHRHAP